MNIYSIKLIQSNIIKLNIKFSKYYSELKNSFSMKIIHVFSIMKPGFNLNFSNVMYTVLIYYELSTLVK